MMTDVRTVSSMEPIPPNFGKARVIKNLIVMSLSLMLIYIAYDGLSMLQSTMNREQNIGTISQAVVDIAFCLSSLILPKYAIKKLGCKVIYLIAAIFYLPYTAANFYPCWTTMVPTAFLMGIGISMVWAAHANYFNASVVLYCSVAESDLEDETKQHLVPICNDILTEKLSSNNSNTTELDLKSGSHPDCLCADVHSQDNFYSTCVEDHNGGSKCKTVEVFRDHSDYLGVKLPSENNSQSIYYLSVEEFNSIYAEVFSEKGSMCKSLDAPFVDNSNHSTNKDYLENDYNNVNADKLTEVISGCNHLESLSTMNPDKFEGENIASTENLSATNFNETNRSSFATTRNGVFSLTNCKYVNLDDSYKILNFENSLRYRKSSCDHTSELVNHRSNESPFIIKIFKGEQTRNIRDFRSIGINKRKLTVSLNSNIDNYPCLPKRLARKILNSLPGMNTESESKVEYLSNLYNPNPETEVINYNKDTQNKQEFPRKNVVEVTDNIEQIESVTACFFGCNGLLFHSAQIWSNLVSYYILQGNAVGNSTNFSHSCGATYCNTEPDDLVESSIGTNHNMRYLLAGIYLILGMLAIILVLFLLDPLPGTEKQPVKFSFHNLTATFHQCTKNIQICLIPMSIYIGMIQGFYTADFTKSYIACALGDSRVGLVTVYYGIACALSSTLSGYIVKYMGRIFVFLLIHVANLVLSTLLLMWKPDRTLPVIFFSVAGLLGVVTGILWSQIPAFYSIVFKSNKEAAFASYYAFNSFGWILSFSYSAYLCTSVKIYIMIVVSSLGVIGYLVAEAMHRERKKDLDSTLA